MPPSRTLNRARGGLVAVLAFALPGALAAPASAAVDFDVSGSPLATGPTLHVASADLNGDSLQDFVAVGDGNVRVFLATGTGSFNLSDSEPLGGSEWVAIGQLNADSNLDLVVTGATGGVPSLRFLFGDGAGSFSFASGSSVQLPGASFNTSIAVGEINSDSSPDVVALAFDGAGDDRVYVATGNGAGSFFLTPGSPHVTSTRQGTSIATGDLNGDATDDVAVSALSGFSPTFNYMSAMLSNSSGALALGAGSPFEADGSGARVVAIADFNGDGDSDLAATNESADHVGTLIGNGTGAFAAAPDSPQTVGDHPYGLAAADVNFDGDPDLLVGNDDSNDLDVLVGDGTGDFTRAAAGPFSLGSVVNATSVAPGDFNGDQKVDAIVATLNGPVLMLNANELPLPPTLTGSSPASPANHNSPRILGSAPEGDTVDLFASDDCTGAPVVEDAPVADLASPGLQGTVPNDQTTDFTARVRSASGFSPCSTPFSFTEDSTGPAPPTVSGVDPSGPANDNSPEVFGTATEVPGTIRFYSNSGCLGSEIGSGPAASFATGIPVSVPNDSATTIHAQGVDPVGNPGACSATFATYVEDSTGPPSPTLTDTDPESPANQNTIRVKGTAAASSIVRIYANPTCAGGALATGTASAFASPGLLVTVGDESTTVLRATATDFDGVASPCSTDSITYVEDSTAPETALIRSSPDRVGRRRASFRFFSSDAARFQCRLDGGPFLSCGSPFVTPRIRRGRHVFEVRGIDSAGNADPVPARRRFRVPAR